MPTSTFNPTLDGYIQNSNANFATARNAATGNANASGNTSDGPSTLIDTGTYYIRRFFFSFNTATLTSANISSAKLRLYVSAKQDNDNDGKDYIIVVPTTFTSIQNSDFGSISFTANSDTQDITSISTGGYIEWTLNAAGIANITQGGTTKFAVMEGHDFDNEAYAGANSTENSITFNTTDNGSNKPELSVTWTPRGGALFFAQL